MGRRAPLAMLTSRRAALAAALLVLLTPARQAGAASTDYAAEAAAAAPGDVDQFTNQLLWGVEAITPDDAWSVGRGGSAGAARAQHWDGDTWNSTKPRDGRLSELYELAAITPTDVWATGNAQNQALAQHWDGRRWTRVPTPPADPDDGEYLTSVDGVEGDDVWAVGFILVDGGSTFAPLIEHWDGTSWTKVPYTLPGGGAQALLHGVTVISATDVWAVGNASDTGGLILHWDGRSWKSVTDIVSPSSGGWISQLNAVDAVAADDIWAVGAGNAPVLLHWDGHAWTRMAARTDETGLLIDLLFGVSAVAADDVWAVGGYGDDFNPDHARILHWDGTTWTEVPAPDPGSTDNALYGVSATGPDDAWAVGSFSNDYYEQHSHYLLLHWDGTSWTRSRP